MVPTTKSGDNFRVKVYVDCPESNDENIHSYTSTLNIPFIFFFFYTTLTPFEHVL